MLSKYFGNYRNISVTAATVTVYVPAAVGVCLTVLPLLAQPVAVGADTVKSVLVVLVIVTLSVPDIHTDSLRISMNIRSKIH